MSEISIHTPREGSDLFMVLNVQFSFYFNPHSPRGERPKKQNQKEIKNIFQSTLPARGATWRVAFCNAAMRFQSTLPARGATFIATLVEQLNIISIHTPREGSDKLHVSSPFLRSYFNPHSPRGERPMELPSLSGTGYFNPHSPRGERLSGFSL